MGRQWLVVDWRFLKKSLFAKMSWQIKRKFHKEIFIIFGTMKCSMKLRTLVRHLRHNFGHQLMQTSGLLSDLCSAVWWWRLADRAWRLRLGSRLRPVLGSANGWLLNTFHFERNLCVLCTFECTEVESVVSNPFSVLASQ